MTLDVVNPALIAQPVTIGSKTAIRAHITAANGHIFTDDEAVINGTLLGQSILIGWRVQLTWEP